MIIVTAVKVVPEDQDIQVAADRTLDYSKAHAVVSTYDLNAIEASAQAAKKAGAKHFAVCVGPASINDSKNNKNILARGVDELFMAADDKFADMDAKATAAALAEAIKGIEGVDLVVCGDGSADLYAQQTDVQLACALGLPVVTAASAIELADGKAVVTRTLETEVETVEVALPAVISVLPDIALPRIAGMRDIMMAGKKPVHQLALADAAKGVEVIETLAPVPAPRKKIVLDASADGAIDQFVAAIAECIR